MDGVEYWSQKTGGNGIRGTKRKEEKSMSEENCQLFHQQKWVYVRLAETCHSGQASCGKTAGKFQGQRRRMLFYRSKGEVGWTILSKKIH